MTRRFFIVLTVALLIFPSVAHSNLRWSIEIPLIKGEEAKARMGDSVYPLGEVVSIPSSSRYPAYTASGWGKPGHTCASAVNAIHILLSVEKGKGRTISVVPSDTIAPAATAGTAVVLKGKGGIGLFGAWTPPSGSEVYVKRSGQIRPLSDVKMPLPGDTIVIEVDRKDIPTMVDIENRPGGSIELLSSSGTSVIGKVIRPVGGTGRFDGTLYQSVGRLRANHPGVIDISTSPYGSIGGFQIVPIKHGDSPEMAHMWSMTQWMIIASEGDSPLAGNGPLFEGFLIPGPVQKEDQEALSSTGIWTSYGRRSLVLCRLNGGPWRWLPEVEGRQDNGLMEVTHLRIYFPNDREPLVD
nr:hypothetical protein [uncultured Dethiosulfovibrio sp.]